MYLDPYQKSVCVSAQRQAPSIRSLVEVVSKVSDLAVSDIIGPSHAAPCAKARQIAAWLSRRYTYCSMPLIAKHIRRKDHTTIMYSVARVNLAIQEANIAAPAVDEAEAWASVLWATPWPALNYRDPMRLLS